MTNVRVSKGNDGHSLLICTALLLFVCANEAKAQRLIMPGNGSEQYQRPDVNVRVRIADSTFTNQGQGANLEEWKFWTIWAIQHWNESTGAKPRLEWDGYSGNDTNLPPYFFQQGVLTISMVNSPSSIPSIGDAASSTVDTLGAAYTRMPIPGRPGGEVSGGNIAIMRRANSGAPSIDWALM